MRVLLTGSRNWPDTIDARAVLADALLDARDNPPGDAPPVGSRMVLVHGDCRDRDGRPCGADALAAGYAVKWEWLVEGYPARDFGPWPACGPLRNRHMVSLGADLLLAFFAVNQRHRGTRGCVDLALAAGIPVRAFDERGPLDVIPPKDRRHTRAVSA